MTKTTVAHISFATCEVCLAYAGRRSAVLAPHFDLAALRRMVGTRVVVREYLHAVHRRHTAGLSLSTRPYTLTDWKRDAAGNRHGLVIVKRACNGCGDELGDATQPEVEAAAAGAPLPDSRLECGCFGSSRDRSAA